MKSRILGLSSLLGVALLTAPLLNCGKGSSQSAQTPASDPPATAAPFTFTQVTSGLARPTALALGGANTLIVSQESTNPLDASIARVDLRTGALRVQGADPAVRTGIAANHAGRLY